MDSSSTPSSANDRHPIALIVGGDGQIGRAVARAMLKDNWRVRLVRRSSQDAPDDLRGRVESLQLDRNDTKSLASALGEGVDAIIDTVAFDDNHARQWLELEGRYNSLVVISTVAVYCDAIGRTMDEAQGKGFPEFPVPITEDQPTISPGSETYPSRKAALEQSLLQHAKKSVTIIRPGSIHGEGSRHPREWWFIKRMLDGRRRIPLAYSGQSRFHTSATDNIAAVCQVALKRPATRVLNAVDPVALSTLQIGQAVASIYGATPDFVPRPGPPKDGVGEHPWCIPSPIVMDMSRALALGYCPVVTYQESLPEVCRSAEAAAKAKIKFPDYLEASFDYAAEDRMLDNL